MESGGNFRRIVFHFFQLLRWKIEKRTGLMAITDAEAFRSRYNPNSPTTVPDRMVRSRMILPSLPSS